MSVILPQHQSTRERAAAAYRKRLERAQRVLDAVMGTSDERRWTARGFCACYVVSYIAGLSLYSMDWLASLPISARPHSGWSATTTSLVVLAVYATEAVVLGVLVSRAHSPRTRPVLGGIAVLLALGASLAAVGALALREADARLYAVAVVLASTTLLGLAARLAGTRSAAIALASFGVLCTGSALSMSGVPSALPLILALVILPLGNALARWPAWVASRGVLCDLLRMKILRDHVARCIRRELGAALLSMLGLCAIIPLLALLANTVLDTPIPVMQMIERCLADPFGAALGVTLMLLSTLLMPAWHVLTLSRELASARASRPRATA